MMQNFKDSDELNTFFHTKIATPLGELICQASENGIAKLLFSDDLYFNNHNFDLTNSNNIKNKHIQQLEDELKRYFRGQLQTFNTPIDLNGTVFQNKVWNILKQVPFGNTRTYSELAIELGSEKKIRAVANANSKNYILLLIPCHRIIGRGNKLIGYRGGIDRKRWLINFEKELSIATSETTLF